MELIKLKKGASVSEDIYKKISNPNYLYESFIYYAEKQKWTKPAIIGMISYIMNEGRPFGFYTYEGCYLDKGTDPDGGNPNKAGYRPVFDNDKWRKWISIKTINLLGSYGHKTIGLSALGVLSETDVWGNGFNKPKTQTLCTDIIDKADAQGVDCHDPELLCKNAIQLIYKCSSDNDYRDPRTFKGTAKEYAERVLCFCGMSGWSYGSNHGAAARYYSDESIKKATDIYEKYKKETEEVGNMAFKMKAARYVEICHNVLNRKTRYENVFPYNCGYYDGTYLYGDCWNFNPKSIIWAESIGKPIDKHYTIGRDAVVERYSKGIKASGLPDATGDYIMSMYCTQVSFKQMLKDKVAPVLLLITGRHMGAYLGDFTKNGKTYNVCEFTPAAALGNGLVPSYVDEAGHRMTCKGGTILGNWSKAGRLTTFIDYSGTSTPVTVSKQETPQKTTTSLYNTADLAVHIIRGDYGTGNARVTKLKGLGYTDSQITAAQKMVDTIYGRNKKDLDCCKIALDIIGGTYGDGIENRKAKVTKKYGDASYFTEAQKKVNVYLSEAGQNVAQKGHYSTDNLAVLMIRGDFGTGEERKRTLTKKGYSAKEIEAAQNMVNAIYSNYNTDKVCCQIAMDLIGGTYGDGAATRKANVKKKYGDDYHYVKAQEKVNSYLA